LTARGGQTRSFALRRLSPICHFESLSLWHALADVVKGGDAMNYLLLASLLLASRSGTDVVLTLCFQECMVSPHDIASHADEGWRQQDYTHSRDGRTHSSALCFQECMVSRHDIAAHADEGLASLLFALLKAACSFSFSKAALFSLNLRLFSAWNPSEEHPKWPGSGRVHR
jgi:hypothetical protein